ncbi:hypothetical protein DNTS_012921 [Danionella cerebrum]|uniref:Uncharacterized protein n=1 Tax=Danionella cerebrum TaxID=2873325 RepID=A0A553PEN2_9TELE|nr:hypothetical protein DNTS_012921 [Danionella translucida]
MAKLQNLNVFLTERLTLAAQEIFNAVEGVFLEYTEEICRSRQEIELLKRRIELTRDQVDSETQTESQEQNCSQIFSKEWKDTAMQMKLEVYTHHEENEAPVCSTSASSSQCLDDFQDQISSKDTAAQFKHSHENSFVNQEIQIKVEPETMEANVSFQLDGNDLGDGLKEPVEDPLSNGIIISNIGSLTHQTKPFKAPFINQGTLLQHMMELGPIHERY